MYLIKEEKLFDAHSLRLISSLSTPVASAENEDFDAILQGIDQKFFADFMYQSDKKTVLGLVLEHISASYLKKTGVSEKVIKHFFDKVEKNVKEIGSYMLYVSDFAFKMVMKYTEKNGDLFLTADIYA